MTSSSEERPSTTVAQKQLLTPDKEITAINFANYNSSNKPPHSYISKQCQDYSTPPPFHLLPPSSPPMDFPSREFFSPAGTTNSQILTPEEIDSIFESLDAAVSGCEDTNTFGDEYDNDNWRCSGCECAKKFGDEYDDGRYCSGDTICYLMLDDQEDSDEELTRALGVLARI